MDKKSGDATETGARTIQTVSPRNTSSISDGDSLKDSLTAVRNATQAAARIHQVFRVQSFQKKQMKEFDGEKFRMSDERALSFLAVKSHKQGHQDEPVHTAAIRIQNKFRSYKGRKDFLIMRQQVVKIQVIFSISTWHNLLVLSDLLDSHFPLVSVAKFSFVKSNSSGDLKIITFFLMTGACKRPPSEEKL